MAEFPILKALRDLVNVLQETKSFCYLSRNQILCCWNENPQTEITKEAASKTITKIEYQDIGLINSIWSFLQRRGTINHGDFKIQRPLPIKENEHHIAIIGGGISGKKGWFLSFKLLIFCYL